MESSLDHYFLRLIEEYIISLDSHPIPSVSGYGVSALRALAFGA